MMYGEMTYHVMKKKGNTDDSSWQDIQERAPW